MMVNLPFFPLLMQCLGPASLGTRPTSLGMYEVLQCDTADKQQKVNVLTPSLKIVLAYLILLLALIH
jgi:hypothetical protein